VHAAKIKKAEGRSGHYNFTGI